MYGVIKTRLAIVNLQNKLFTHTIFNLGIITDYIKI